MVLFTLTTVSTGSARAQRMPRGGGSGPFGQGASRERGRPECDSARIQTRSYQFPDTKKKLEYDVFVSSKVDRRRSAPLVIALHGANEPPRDLLGCLADAAEPGGYIVAAPMGYTLEGWYGVPDRIPPGTQPANLAELSEQDVLHVLDLMRQQFNVDDHRTYLLGQSMGGAGALYLGTRYHDRWAAVAASAPAAGTLSPAILETAKDVPFILIQGDADQVVSIPNTGRWAERMRELRMTSEYDELPGVDHRGAIVAGARRIFAFFNQHAKP
jgi:predicted peptidase